MGLTWSQHSARFSRQLLRCFWNQGREVWNAGGSLCVFVSVKILRRDRQMGRCLHLYPYLSVCLSIYLSIYLSSIIHQYTSHHLTIMCPSITHRWLPDLRGTRRCAHCQLFTRSHLNSPRKQREGC